MPLRYLLEPINLFLRSQTPDEWIVEAKKPANLPLILCDHLLCELKAAQSAMYLIRKYALDNDSSTDIISWLKPYEDYAYKKIGNLQSLKEQQYSSKQLKTIESCPYGNDLTNKMVLLIKEELHHFYQVLEIMEERGIAYQSVPASRYAKSLLKHVSHHEPDALVDKLIIGAFIEARSCERFAKLAPHLDKKMESFYLSLLRSEARHYQDYLALAKQIADKDISHRIDYFAQLEANLISSYDFEFKFHSGRPLSKMVPSETQKGHQFYR